jgi:hypothetical protein
MGKRKRRVGSVADELVKKAREAMLTAVQIFNNPQVEFKSELFIVTSIIAWTYLIHAHFRKKGVEYRKFTQHGERRKFELTRYGAYWHISLWDCLDHEECPLEEMVKTNLRFLIGIRHEIEHQMTSRIDDSLSAKFQASALNFNTAIKKLFGEKNSLDAEQAFSIQFCGIDEKTAKELMDQPGLPSHIRSYVAQFENVMSAEEFNDPRFSYRVAFVRKTSNSKNIADKVVEFVPAGSGTAEEMNKVYLKETEKRKYLPGTIVKMMKAEGYAWFNQTKHTDLWKAKAAKGKPHFGADVEGRWLWYEPWLEEVRKYCAEEAAKIAEATTNPAATPTPK